MAEINKSTDTKTADTKAEAKAAEESYQEEIQRLRSRIRELQAKVRQKESADDTDEADDEFDEASDILRDMPGRAMDEASKFVRGFTMAYLEQLRLMGEMLSTVADEVSGRNRSGRRRSTSRRDSSGRRRARDTEERSSPSDLANDLPGDIISGVVNALDKSMDGPRRVVDRFYDAYRESDEMDKPRRDPKST